MAGIIKNSRGGKKKKKRGQKSIDDFRRKLGFKLQDITMNKDKSVITKILKAFSNESILP